MSSTGSKTMAKVTQFTETKQNPPDKTTVTYTQPCCAVNARQPTRSQALRHWRPQETIGATEKAEYLRCNSHNGPCLLANSEVHQSLGKLKITTPTCLQHLQNTRCTQSSKYSPGVQTAGAGFGLAEMCPGHPARHHKHSYFAVLL